MRARLCDLCKGPAAGRLEHPGWEGYQIKVRARHWFNDIFGGRSYRLDICPSCWERIAAEAKAAQETR